VALPIQLELRRAIAATSLGGTALGEDASALLEAAMAACDPVAWVARNVVREGDGVRIGSCPIAAVCCASSASVRLRRRSSPPCSR
jgi:hypothetical protein